ncbi:MAG: aminotransferase class V-fold PLP-dependent enzyme [Verrucomicrobia subdivision 3 bacterium]|nr:aminotransferase class V-fold PLP-dependent enzyme [Limisphaerales bacterium]
MTLEDILTNEELRRQEFPVARERIFLAHAGDCPLPRRVGDAIREYLARAEGDDQEGAIPSAFFSEARNAAARLLQAQPEEISFVGPTSLALSYVASGLPLRKGDNIVIYQDDYPSNVYPWIALAERGVQVRFLNIRHYGHIRLIDVEGQIDENTRLVALASCHFISGQRIDVQGIGCLLQKRGIAFCVDAIQTIGAFPTSVEYVDFMAADAHKWLLGPCAAGVLYVRKSWQEQLRPPVYGWHNVRCPNYVAQEKLAYPPDGRRYEAGSANLVGLAGLKAAMEMLLEIGIDNIGRELLRKRAWLVPALQAKGYSVLYPDAPPETASGIVTFSATKNDSTIQLHARLSAANIVTSLRADRQGNRYIRLSPHFYNTDTELRRLMELL